MPVIDAIPEEPLIVNYSLQMTEVRQTPVFRKWLDDLADRRAAGAHSPADRPPAIGIDW
jgi:hypothetical protein